MYIFVFVFSTTDRSFELRLTIHGVYNTADFLILRCHHKLQLVSHITATGMSWAIANKQKIPFTATKQFFLGMKLNREIHGGMKCKRRKKK